MTNIPQGWQCPVCGRVYSPGTPECTRCATPDTECMDPDKIILEAAQRVEDALEAAYREEAERKAREKNRDSEWEARRLSSAERIEAIRKRFFNR